MINRIKRKALALWCWHRTAVVTTVVCLMMLLQWWAVDTVYSNSIDVFREDMMRTRAVLELTPAQVIFIDPRFAERLHFEPREGDLDFSDIDWSEADRG